MGVKEERLVESVLFSANQPVSINEIKEATGLPIKKVKDAFDLVANYRDDVIKAMVEFD